MHQDLFDWLLLLGRWVHITVAVTWIGTSIFFMWLDRTLIPNPNAQREGHIGELWMVHGGGFYHVEKMQMGPTKVPPMLHWFKWESYWTWMSGFFLVVLIFYTGEGTFLLDNDVSHISYYQGLMLGLFSIFGSWFFYDTLWERKFTREKPFIGHLFTLIWFLSVSYLLCKTLSGRAAYIHIGAMLGTWMTANVFMRIIPRQIKMVEASEQGLPVNQEWSANAKNRSTHNTYFTLPVIFIMLSNHFPNTYGHELNWAILFLICAGGASIREYFVSRLQKPKHSKRFALLGSLSILLATYVAQTSVDGPSVEKESSQLIEVQEGHSHQQDKVQPVSLANKNSNSKYTLKGVITFEGVPPKGKKLRLPQACASQYKGPVYSNEIITHQGKLKNVLVRVIKGHEGQTFAEAPKEEVELDQRGCLYVPRVAAARVGQPVVFINSDPLFHNVRSLTKENRKFNMAMPRKHQRATKIFTRPEIFLQAKCSVHPWMGAYLAIMDHPFFSVSNAQGEVTIQNLPEGKYTIEAWHESLGTQTKEITINGEMTPNLNFTFKGP